MNALSSMNRKVVKLQAEKENLASRVSRNQGDHAKEIVMYERVLLVQDRAGGAVCPLTRSIALRRDVAVCAPSTRRPRVTSLP